MFSQLFVCPPLAEPLEVDTLGRNIELDRKSRHTSFAWHKYNHQNILILVMYNIFPYYISILFLLICSHLCIIFDSGYKKSLNVDVKYFYVHDNLRDI